jgi:hypothetical protein
MGLVLCGPEGGVRLLRLPSELKKTIPFESGGVKRPSGKSVAVWRGYAGKDDRAGKNSAGTWNPCKSPVLDFISCLPATPSTSPRTWLVVSGVTRSTSCRRSYGPSARGPVDLDDPPRGAWYQVEFNGFVVGATTRHPIPLFLVPFMCVWSGGSLGGIYGSEFVHGTFDLPLRQPPWGAALSLQPRPLLPVPAAGSGRTRPTCWRRSAR